MARLSMPQIPDGNLRTLLEELHLLHARAGWPSTRDIARHRAFSHTAVHDLFTRTTSAAPRIGLLLDVVEGLATEARGVDDVVVEVDRFDKLWRFALENPFGAATGKPPRTPEVAIQSARDVVLTTRSDDVDTISRSSGLSLWSRQPLQPLRFSVLTREQEVALKTSLDERNIKYTFAEAEGGLPSMLSIPARQTDQRNLRWLPQLIHEMQIGTASYYTRSWLDDSYPENDASAT